ncbi:MAG TPA: hypothetical protein VFW07_18760 [Parafilimonas sp.]|nr:hypothetical protein [Parafilimonas sp.]
MNTDIKNELHKLIDNCDNKLLLSEAKALLESGNEIKDWWDELTEEDRNLVMESEVEYEKGNFISHDDLMQQLEKWKENSLDFNRAKRLLGNRALFGNKLAIGSSQV